MEQYQEYVFSHLLISCAFLIFARSEGTKASRTTKSKAKQDNSGSSSKRFGFMDYQAFRSFLLAIYLSRFCSNMKSVNSYNNIEPSALRSRSAPRRGSSKSAESSTVDTLRAKDNDSEE